MIERRPSLKCEESDNGRPQRDLKEMMWRRGVDPSAGRQSRRLSLLHDCEDCEGGAGEGLAGRFCSGVKIPSCKC